VRFGQSAAGVKGGGHEKGRIHWVQLPRDISQDFAECGRGIPDTARIHYKQRRKSTARRRQSLATGNSDSVTLSTLPSLGARRTHQAWRTESRRGTRRQATAGLRVLIGASPNETESLRCGRIHFCAREYETTHSRAIIPAPTLIPVSAARASFSTCPTLYSILK